MSKGSITIKELKESLLKDEIEKQEKKMYRFPEEKKNKEELERNTLLKENNELRKENNTLLKENLEQKKVINFIIIFGIILYFVIKIMQTNNII